MNPQEIQALIQENETLKNENKALKTRIAESRRTIRSIFGPYLTDEVLEAMQKQENHLVIGGTRQRVTMLFSDIRNSTALSEEMPSDGFIRMLNHYLKEMIELINAWQGNILDFVGDAIVVVFGAPRPIESTSLNAVACAVSMQRRMVAVNEWNRQQHFPDISMGIGIHTGDAILGNIGSTTRTKYDMIGRNVNLTSRIESVAAGGQILITPDVLQETGGNVHIREGGDQFVELKGIRGPVHLHEVIGFGKHMLPGYEKSDPE